MPSSLLRAAGVAAVILLASVAPAAAGPGGSLSGELTVSWASGAAEPGNAWAGSVTLRLDPGSAATERAMTAIRDSGRVYRAPRSYFVQASHIAALSSAREARSAAHCSDEEGNPVPGDETFSQRAGAVTQPLVPLSVDQPDLDLLRGRGVIEADLYTDNPGYIEGSETWPFPIAGAYFMPVPGSAEAPMVTTSCGQRTEGARVADVFDTRRDGLVPFAFAEWLNVARLPLTRRAGRWVIETSRTEEAATFGGELPLTMRYDLRLGMSGDLRAMGARCRVPRAKQLKGLSLRRARARLVQAGFRRPRFAGSKPWQPVKPGRLFVDPDFTSTGYRRCGDRPKLFRAVRFR